MCQALLQALYHLRGRYYYYALYGEEKLILGESSYIRCSPTALAVPHCPVTALAALVLTPTGCYQGCHRASPDNPRPGIFSCSLGFLQQRSGLQVMALALAPSYFPEYLLARGPRGSGHGNGANMHLHSPSSAA